MEAKGMETKTNGKKVGRKEVLDAIAGTEKEAKVTVAPIRVERITLKIVGDTSYLCNRFSEKAKKQIEDKTKGKFTQRAAKDPEAEYRGSLYHIDGDENRCGIPCSAFKQAMIAACTKGSTVSKTLIKQAVHVVGELSEIKGKHRMHSCIARVGKFGAKQPDMRHRAEFPEWSTELQIRYNAGQITPEVIINILNIAGFGVGVGEWRPEKCGTFGCFHVEV
jgi:hypothetical protein